MTDQPPKGQMYLFDSITPPLYDGSYRVTAETDVSVAGSPPTFQDQRYFNIVGPRFSVPQGMVAGCFPPNNSHGAFDETLPHIVLSRRTLPWERKLYATDPLPTPKTSPDDPPALDLERTPWVALLLFEEGEYTLYRNIPLEQAVPAAVFTRLGSPAGIVCDAVEADSNLIAAIMPSLEEIQLLAHGRWVNVDDRELNTAGGDGFYSVVVSNRLPSPGAQCRAVLVSLEERFDLIQADPPATAEPYRPRPPTSAPGPIYRADQNVGQHLDRGQQLAGASDQAPTLVVRRRADVVDVVDAVDAVDAVKPAEGAQSLASQVATGVIPLTKAVSHQFTADGPIYVGPVDVFFKSRLVALTSWKFTCEQGGTFRELTQHLDDRMFGSVVTPGQPALSDTGHLKLTLQDRLGASEEAWYRGPLVPYNLTRDPLGPYHSADQARRATPDTGAEDVSYAAAFELGRLLAAADARLAQSLMRWRRESYRQSARASVIKALAARAPLALPPTLAERLHTPIVPIVASAATQIVAQARPPIADVYGIAKVASAPGMDPIQLASAWNLSSPAEATAMLGADPGSLGSVANPVAQTARPNTTLDAVAADAAGLERLSAARDQLIEDTLTQLGGA
jgi:hypothetical protein